MWTYIVRRLLQAIPTLILVTLVAFVLMDLVPGTAVSAMRDPRTAQLPPDVYQQLMAHYGLDQPAPIRYIKFLGNALMGDLGYSLRFNQKVTAVVMERLSVTITLALLSIILAAIVGLATGIVAALYRGRFFDLLAMIGALAGVYMPVFWFGFLLILLFSVNLKLLPASGWGGGQVQYLILPVLTLGLAITAIIARVSRSSMLEVLSSDYVITARAKGLSGRIVVYKHVFKNALIPVVTVVGAQVGFLLGGAVLTETIFALPGLGRLIVWSILYRDLPTVQGALILVALIFVVVNLVTDLSYAFIDPRVRYQ
jgi:ABC-type dipeptide/oligopeptide/nickel transport system permease component